MLTIEVPFDAPEMNSSMSNFNIKKSFVWKYGLSKLQKKKVSCYDDDEAAVTVAGNL